MSAPMLQLEDVVAVRSGSSESTASPGGPITFEAAVARRTPIYAARPVDVWPGIPDDAMDPVTNEAALAVWRNAARAWRPTAADVVCCAPVRAMRADASFRVVRAPSGGGELVAVCHWPERGLAMLGVVPRARAARGSILRFDTFDAPAADLLVEETVAPSPTTAAVGSGPGPFRWLLALVDPARPALAPANETWPAARLHTAIKRYVQSIQAGADPALEHAAPFVYLHGLSRAAHTPFGERELATWATCAARTPGLLAQLVGPGGGEWRVPATLLYLEGATVERGFVRVPPERAGEAAAAIVVELLRETRMRINAWAAAGPTTLEASRGEAALRAPDTARFITTMWDAITVAQEQLIDIEDLGRDFATLMPPCMETIYGNLKKHTAHPKFAQRGALTGFYVGLGIPAEPIVRAWEPDYRITDPRFASNWAGVTADIREMHRKQITCGKCSAMRERGLCPTDDVAWRAAGLTAAEARLVSIAGNAYKLAADSDLEAAEAAGLKDAAVARGHIGVYDDRAAFRRAMYEHWLSPLVLNWLAADVPANIHRVRCATLLLLRTRGESNPNKIISAPLTFTKVLLDARRRTASDRPLSVAPLRSLSSGFGVGGGFREDSVRKMADPENDVTASSATRGDTFADQITE